MVSFQSCLGKRNRSQRFHIGLGVCAGRGDAGVRFALARLAITTHWARGPSAPKLLSPNRDHRCDPACTLFRDGCLFSRPRAQPLGPPGPRSPPFPGKIPAGLVVAQAKEERPHPQDDYNLGHRTDLHVLVPSSSVRTRRAGGSCAFLFFSCLSFFTDGCWLELLCICLELDGQTSALLWGWGEHQQPNRHCFWSCFYFQKPMNLMVEPVPSEEG